MHPSSKVRMERFARLCLNLYGKDRDISLLDVGGEAAFSYKDIFDRYFNNLSYKIMNVESGCATINDATVYVKNFYDWTEFKDESFDIVISGQTLEHIEYPWMTLLEMRRVLKNGGWMCIVAPSHWPLHRFPVDTYRYYTDGLEALAKYAGLSILYAGADHPPADTIQQGDCYIVAQKNDKHPQEVALKYKRIKDASLAVIPQLDEYDIASQCSFTQSSHAQKWEAQRKIGTEYNILSGNFTGEYAIHTSAGEQASIIITLPEKRHVKKMLIFNREGYDYKSTDISIYCSTDLLNYTKVLEKTGIFGGIIDAKPLIVPIDREVRIIIIQQNNNQSMHFDQIRIIASLNSKGL